MQHLEVSGAVVLYIGRTVSKVWSLSRNQRINALKAICSLHIKESHVMSSTLCKGDIGTW
jgi:hypothetical protein